MYQQTCVYDFLNSDIDPLYQKIQSLNEGEEVIITPFVVQYTEFGIYEITSEDIHEPYKTLDDCYKALNHFMFLKEDD